MKSLHVLGVVLATYTYMAAVHADGKMTELLTDGEWIALSSQTRMDAPPDVCIAASKKAGFGFMADKNTTEIRVGDNKWSLSESMVGSVELTVGAYSGRFAIQHVYHGMVAAQLTDSQLLLLFRAMNEATSLTVKIGKFTKTVPLVGSTNVSEVFKACLGLTDQQEHKDHPDSSPSP